MNVTIANQIVEKTAQLTILCATFQGKFGRTYRLKPGSPQEAWTLYQQILDTQRMIAGLLDPDIVEKPISRGESWWKQQDVIDTTVTQNLLLEAHQLLARCAYTEAVAQNEHPSPGIACAQAVIAGMLHPHALLEPVRNIYAA